MLGREAERLVQKPVDAADHPPGAGNQHHGQSELRDHQQAAGKAQAASRRSFFRPLAGLAEVLAAAFARPAAT